MSGQDFGNRLAAPAFKSVVISGRSPRFGWSRCLAPTLACIVARHDGGTTSLLQARCFIDQVVEAGKMSSREGDRVFRSIQGLDEKKGGVEDVRNIRALAKVLGMRVVTKATEPGRPYEKPRWRSRNGVVVDDPWES